MANINVIAPDGQVGTVPEENYDQALAAGYKMATPGEVEVQDLPLKSPDGEIGSVPRANYQDALQAGFIELSPEESDKYFASKTNEQNPATSKIVAATSRSFNNVSNTLGIIGGVGRTVRDDPSGVVDAALVVPEDRKDFSLENVAKDIIPGYELWSSVGEVAKKSQPNIEKVSEEVEDVLGHSPRNAVAKDAQLKNPLSSAAGDLFADTVGSIGAGLVMDPVEQEANDSWLQDRAISSENIALYGTLNTAGAVLGGALGSAVPLLKNSADDIGAKAANHVLQHVDNQAGARAAGVAQDAITADVKSLAEAEKVASSGAKSHIVKNVDTLRSASVDDVTNTLKSIREEIDTLGSRSLSEEELSKTIKKSTDFGTNYVATQGSAISIKDYLRRTAEEIAESEPKLAKKLNKYVSEMEKSSKPSTWFSSGARATDDLEQAIGRLAKSGDSTALPRLQNAQVNLRRELTNNDVWGNAAAAETKRFNSYNTTYGPATSQLDDAFFNSSGSLIPDKIEAAIKSGSTKVVDNYLAEGRRVADYIATFDSKAGAALNKKIDRAETSINKVKFYTDVEKNYAPKMKAVSELGKNVTEIIKELPGVRSAVHTAKAVGYGAKVLGNITNVTDSKVAKGVYETLVSANNSVRKFWKSSVEKGLKAVIDRPKNSRWAQRPIAGAVSGSAAANVFSDWSKDPYSYKTDTQKIVSLSKDPEALADKIADSFGSLATSHPQVFSDILGQQYKAVMFLASKAPTVPRRGIAASKNYVPSEDQVWEYSLYWSAVMDPESVAEAISTGTAKAQQLEALQVVYPQKYLELKETVLEELNRMDELGLPVSINGRAMIDQLLNTDGAGDPALSWDVALNVSTSRQTKTQQDANINPTGVSQSPSANSLKSQGIN